MGIAFLDAYRLPPRYLGSEDEVYTNKVQITDLYRLPVRYLVTVYSFALVGPLYPLLHFHFPKTDNAGGFTGNRHALTRYQINRSVLRIADWSPQLAVNFHIRYLV